MTMKRSLSNISPISNDCLTLEVGVSNCPCETIVWIFKNGFFFKFVFNANNQFLRNSVSEMAPGKSHMLMKP